MEPTRKRVVFGEEVVMTVETDDEDIPLAREETTTITSETRSKQVIKEGTIRSERVKENTKQVITSQNVIGSQNLLSQLSNLAQQNALSQQNSLAQQSIGTHQQGLISHLPSGHPFHQLAATQQQRGPVSQQNLMAHQASQQSAISQQSSMSQGSMSQQTTRNVMVQQNASKNTASQQQKSAQKHTDVNAQSNSKGMDQQKSQQLTGNWNDFATVDDSVSCDSDEVCIPEASVETQRTYARRNVSEAISSPMSTNRGNIDTLKAQPSKSTSKTPTFITKEKVVQLTKVDSEFNKIDSQTKRYSVTSVDDLNVNVSVPFKDFAGQAGVGTLILTCDNTKRSEVNVALRGMRSPSLEIIIPEHVPISVDFKAQCGDPVLSFKAKFIAMERGFTEPSMGNSSTARSNKSESNKPVSRYGVLYDKSGAENYQKTIFHQEGSSGHLSHSGYRAASGVHVPTECVNIKVACGPQTLRF